MCVQQASVAELVDALDSKSCECEFVGVRFPPGVQKKLNNENCWAFCFLLLICSNDARNNICH
jgi:hypothetical protein